MDPREEEEEEEEKISSRGKLIKLERQTDTKKDTHTYLHTHR